jgi:hypothetical protein
MSLLDYLERKVGRFAVPQVTAGLIACQVVVYLAGFVLDRPGREPIASRLEFIPGLVLQGEVWRLLTFLVMPPFTNIVFAFFFWYLFYLMGTALERTWGTFRYNVYLLLGYVATVGLAFILPGAPATNAYLQGSVFLAFAYLYPDFEMYLFFILPVKIKWLALVTWIGYGLVLIFGSWEARLMVLASVCNFLVFFGKDIVQRVRTGRRRMEIQARRYATAEPAYYHRCTVCGITDRTNPDMDFRYCSKCAGNHGYCMQHLHSHEHVAAPAEIGNRESRTQ